MRCELCGNEISDRPPNSKYCLACVKSGKSHRVKKVVPTARVKKGCALDEISRINVAAQQMGLSYGQYVAKYGGSKK